MRNPLSKRPNRPATLPADVQAALAQLRQLAETQPDLAPLSQTTAALLQVMYSDVPVVPFRYTPADVALKAEGGVPLLRGTALDLDGAWLTGRWTQLCEVLRGTGHTGARGLADAARQGRLAIPQLAAAISQDDPGQIALVADELGLDAELAATLLRLTLFPLLSQVSAAARPHRAADGWTAGYCPTCGAWPLLGEYRGLEQTRFLRCGLCADEWAVDRFLCFACGTRVHQDLQYLGVSGEDMQYRVHACIRCHSYLKHVTTFGALPAPALLVTDLRTLHLDLVALERAFTAPR